MNTPGIVEPNPVARRVIKPWWVPLFSGILLLGAGCATPTSGPALAYTGDRLLDGRAAISQGPARDKVLWQCRTALEAMRRGQYQEAKQMLDDALTTIQNRHGKDKSARQSRSYFREESRKTFMGEPYERAMAYYYRGILYWMDGEWDNARACFRSGQLEDSDTENKVYANDYALLEYLDGLATAKFGGDGSDAFERAQGMSRSSKLPPYHPEANVLFFIEFGQGPTKYATGEYREQLRFHPGASAACAVEIRMHHQALRLPPYDDLSFQATTRGGRVMDYILANKAVFKTSADVAGDAALVSSLILAHDRDTNEAALGLAVFGLLSKIVSASTTPAADTRSWDNLPQFLTFAAIQIPLGKYSGTVEFLDANGKALPALTKTIELNIGTVAKDMVVFLSDRSTTTR